MSNEILGVLKETGALLEGHFLLSSGRHSDRYAQMAKLLQYPDKAAFVLSDLCERLKQLKIDVVCGPAMGGIVVAYEIGRELSLRAIVTERENNEMTLRRGFEIKPGERVLITEDVVTTGKSSKETAAVIEKHGGEVVGIACVVDRSREEVFCPVYSAVKLDIENFLPEECPLCKKGIPAVKPGSRKF